MATVVTLGMTLLIWLGRRRPSPDLPRAARTDVVSSAATISNEQRANMPSHDGNLGGSAAVAPNTIPEAGKSKAEQMLNVLSNYNDVPIDFYGKLEDQFSNPVPDATINFEVQINNGYESTVKRGHESADANGRFTISGQKGESLSVVPEKAGYAIASLNGGGRYSLLYPEEQRMHPDRNNPVIIKMWKLQGAEPLVMIKQRYSVHDTETPIYIDLLAGKLVPSGGDVKITVNRAQTWNVKVEAVDGGLMDSAGRELITYSAPLDGYLAASDFSFPTNVEGLNRGYFVMSRNGQVYSKLGISFRFQAGPDGNLTFYCNGVASTNGSHNWEGDPNTYKP